MQKYKYYGILKAINEKEETQKKICKLLQIKENSFRYKLAGKTEWTVSEIDTLCEHFNKSYEELFKE